jgi:plastocyanin
MKMRIKATMTGSAFLLLSLFLLASCGGGGGGGYNTPPPGTSTVQSVLCTGISATVVEALATSFSPPGVTISANQVVQWNNNSVSIHSVTRTTQPAGGTFDVALNDLTSVCLKFTTVGTFDYYCTVHGSTMNGSVTVTP